MSRPVTLTLLGGVRLDTDKDTRLGLKYTGGLLGIKDGGAVRSYDLSIPATTHNDKVLQYSEMAEADGLRQSFPAELRCGGIGYEGRIYLKRWASSRYELLFVVSALTADTRLENEIGRYFRPLDTVYCEKGIELTFGSIHNFGYYPYNNRWNNGRTGTQDIPPTMYPSTNLGYLIEGTANALGYGVVWNNGGNTYADPYNMGILLSSMTPVTTASFTVTGNASTGFYSPLESAITPYGLHYVARRFKRGLFNSNKTAHVFEATAPCRVHIDNVGANYVVRGVGKDVLAEPYDCLDIEMEAGDYFTIVNASDRVRGWFGWYWHGTSGYTTNIDPVTLEVVMESQVPVNGSTIYLKYLLPKMSLSELLDAYCLLACATWGINGGNIYVWTFAERLAQTTIYADLDTIRVSSVEYISRYVEGFADHNLLCCTTRDEWLAHDVLVGLNPNVFWRDYRGGNDWLSEVDQYGIVPFFDGEWFEESGHRIAYFDDIDLNDDGTYTYNGKLSIFFANQDGSDNWNAWHISTIDAEGGIAQDFAEFVAQAVTALVSIPATLDWFAGLQPVSVCRWRGRDWLIKEAAWGDGVAQLELVRLPL